MKQYTCFKNVSTLGGFVNFFSSKRSVTFLKYLLISVVSSIISAFSLQHWVESFFSVSKALRSKKEHHVPADCPGHMLHSCAKFAADQLAYIARRLIFKIYNRFF